ncbi:Transposase DDE domain group 1 [Acidocella aminolytica 101 = DSM 11237]|nr:Transposase DDE domain group 1 [Acidocella aminolytica 101 = DSM 11237]
MASADLRVAFDRRLKLEFHGPKVTSDAGLLAFQELDDALGLTEMAGQLLTGSRTGKNNRHTLTAQFRQSVFSRLAEYEDVNDDDRLGHDPAMRWIIGGRAVMKEAASASQMERFETEELDRQDQPHRFGRAIWTMDRCGSCPPPNQYRGAGHGQQRQPHPWRTGRHRLQR